jgi:hypothetical protein
VGLGVCVGKRKKKKEKKKEASNEILLKVQYQ